MTVLVMVSYSLVRPVTSAVTSWGGPGGPYRRCDGGSPFMELTVGARWAIFSSLHCCKKLLRSGALLQTIQMKSMIGTGPWFSRWARRDPSGSPARLLGSTGSSRQETPTRGSLPGGGGHTRVSTPETTVWPPASEEPEPQEPERGSAWQSIRRNGQAKCLLLTALMLGCLAAVTWCRVTLVPRYVINYARIPMRSETLVSPCDEGYVYVPLALLLMLYLVYLVECWHCSTRLQLAYRVDASAVYHLAEQMRHAQPIIWWKAVCYHYVRRSRLVTRYRNGDPYTSTQVYYERVNTHSAGSCFVYSQCGVRDISKRLTGLEKHPATKIRFSKGFAFANLEAAQEFEEQRTRFFRENERLDDYMEMREGLDLVGAEFQEYMVAFADRLPWYVSHNVFWLFSALLLSWPLRVLVDCRTAHVHYQVTKLFGEPASPATGGRLSRGSTVDSAELERSITDNFTLAPSYSQAVLMESAVTDPNGNIPVRRHRSSWTGPVTSQMVYTVPPLSPDDVSVMRCCPDAPGPPSYDQVVPPHGADGAFLASRLPLRFFLRRSVTERNLSCPDTSVGTSGATETQL